MKVRIAEMTWKEVEEAIARRPVTLIPIGTCECQSLHNVMGYDYFVAEKLAYEVGKATESIVAPALPVGYSELFLNYPGTITLRAETFIMVIEDMLRSLIRAGLDHFLFIDNHKGNHAFTQAAARKIKREFGITCASVWPTAIARYYAKDQFENPDEVLIHGAEPGTSLMRYLQGNNIRMDLAKKTQRPDMFDGMKLASATAFKHEEMTVDFYLNMDETSEFGGFGDPTQGSVEIGKRIFENMVDHVSRFVLKFKNVNTVSATKSK